MVRPEIRVHELAEPARSALDGLVELLEERVDDPLEASGDERVAAAAGCLDDLAVVTFGLREIFDLGLEVLVRLELGEEGAREARDQRAHLRELQPLEA